MAMSLGYSIILHILFDSVPYYCWDILEADLFRQDNDNWQHLFVHLCLKLGVFGHKIFESLNGEAVKAND